MRGVRLVPPTLPDVPRDRGGGAVAPRTDRCHARRAVARRAGRRRVRALHGDVRAVPRLRAGVPERGPVRPPHGGHPGGAGRRAPHRTPAPARRLRRARAAPRAARRVDAARRRAAAAPRAAARRPGPLAAAARPAGGGLPGGIRRPRVALHGLRHGRLDARHPPRDGRPARRRRGDLVRLAGRLLRCAPRPRRARRQRPRPRRRGDPLDARRRPDRRQLGGVWRGDEGLRPPARHARSRRVRGARGRRAGVARPTHRPPASATAAARSRDRAGPVPPPPRAARPRAGADRGGATSPTSSSSTTRGCAAAPVAPTRRCNRRSPARSATARSPPSIAPRAAPAPASWPAPTPAARCTSPLPG